MADDTVEAARIALLSEMNDCLERAFAQHGKGSGRLVELLDALIAAVRAEQPRYGVIAEHDQHGGNGWTLIDWHERRVTGGWFADRVAAERTADTMNAG